MIDELPGIEVPINTAATDISSPATRVATKRQRRAALWLCVLLSVITILLLPYAKTPWPKMPSFLPIYQTTVIATYLIAAYLMYGQYKATRSLPLLHMGAACLYTAVMLIIQFFSIPGMFIEGARLFGSSQTSIYLWLFWHAGPAVAILLFAWSEFRHSGAIAVNHKRSVRLTALVLMGAIAASTASVTVFQDSLAILDVNGNYKRITHTGVAPALQVLLILSLFILWKASRFRNVLHIWLGVSLVALLCDNFMTMAGETRLSLGWYVGRLSGLFSSVVMMLVYLKEISRAYQESMLVVDSLNALQIEVIKQLRAEIKVRVTTEEELRLSYIHLRQLSDHQENIKNEERRRIAIDIHDDLGQSLMTLKIDVSMFQARTGKFYPRLDLHVQRVLGTIDNSIKSVRSIINDLHPVALELGLCAAVEWQIRQFERHNAIACRLIVTNDSTDASLNKRHTAAIFRIIQESLVNISRHAKADKVTVSLELNAELLTIVIADNGIGILPGDDGKVSSFGLRGIRERITAFGGELFINSGKGLGTTLTITIPAMISQPANGGLKESSQPLCKLTRARMGR